VKFVEDSRTTLYLLNTTAKAFVKTIKKTWRLFFLGGKIKVLNWIEGNGMTENKKKKITPQDNGMKNGLALVSIGLLMFMIMGVNKQTMAIENPGVVLTSLLVVVAGIVVAARSHKRSKGDKK
jgi:hypothetical protein